MRSILTLMAAVAIAFIVVIWFGFWIHTNTNAIPDEIFGVVAYIGIFAIALFLGCWMLGISPWSGWTAKQMFGPRQRAQPQPREVPVRHYSAAEMAYLMDRNATATCAHLQPIERAMRLAGITVYMQEDSDSIIKALCLINEDELRRLFQLPPSITYRERCEPEDFGIPRADITCGYCLKADRARCKIAVYHPQEYQIKKQWFPSPP